MKIYQKLGICQKELAENNNHIKLVKNENTLSKVSQSSLTPWYLVLY